MEMKARIKDMDLHGEDLQGFDVFSNHQEEVVVGQEDEEIWFETASQHHQNNSDNNNNNNDLLDVDVSDPSSLFYAEFPPLPDFPCMSSSSSSSSTPAATKPFMTSTATSSSASTASSGAASWAVLKSDADHDPSSSTAVSMDIMQQSNTQQSGGGHGLVMDDVDQCMDMMQNFGCIDLLESSDICWDPSPLFEDDNDNDHDRNHDNDQSQLLQQTQQELQTLEHDQEEEENVFQQFMLQGDSTTTGTGCIDVGQSSDGGVQHQGLTSPDDLGMVFFEWLKTNKETISAEDLRNIKIKKSTIESAAKRLGGGKEGMKQLLKLILQWVQNHHLQSKRIMMVEDDNPSNNINSATPTNDLSSSPNPNPNHDLNCTAVAPTDQQCFSPTTWLPPPPVPFVGDPSAMVQLPVPPPPAQGFTPMAGYMGGDPYSSTPAAYPPPPIQPSEYQTWALPAAPMQYGLAPYNPFPDPSYGGYGTAYPAGYYYHPGPGEGLVRLGSSATKEARKKRMARQRRFFTHHHRSHHNGNPSHNGHVGINQHNPMIEPQVGVGNGNCGIAPLPGHGNWVYWPHPPPQPTPPAQAQVSQSVNGSGPMVGQMMAAPPLEGAGNGFQRQVGVEKKQGWKTEKNLRFLLQKVLKQSDVGNLGRIVLPKKEAETHLPELEARDGIPIAMEDIGTSRVWNMRYRFWPNNKSRMYLLENTGDFVRSNGLQEGDFIVIYSDVKCGKYMIRGVKVRPQQQAAKTESTSKNKSSKTQKTHGSSSPAGNGSSTSPIIMQ